MRLFARSLIVLFFFTFLATCFASVVSAATTPFRSARIITTDGKPPYTNLENCSATDTNTCDRETGTHYGNLYFRDFGTYEEFGMPQGSTISAVKIRVTGKTSWTTGIGLSLGTTFTQNCQWPLEIWKLYQLVSPTITTQTFVTEVSKNSGLVYCLNPYTLENKYFIWRINYASPNAWSANIDNFEIAFDYELPPTPTPTPTKTPLILIPGIGGSELKTAESVYWSQPDGHGGIYEHAYAASEKIWVNTAEALKTGEDDYFDVLRLKPDGQTSEANLAITGNLFEAYQDMINFFTSNGYTMNTNLFVFPYDWRKDIGLTASLLDEKIQSIKQQTGATQVDIVAHSMGGMVARNYIADANTALNVNKLITLGTPYLGSVKFLSALRYGICLLYGIDTFCLTLASSELKDVLQNATAGFEVAPTEKYFTFYDGSTNQLPYPLSDIADIDHNGVTGQLNYTQIKTFLSNLGHNTNLFGTSEIFHNLDNNLATTNGVSITHIVGSGLPTVGQIIEKYSIDLLGITIPHRDELEINGDNTVPLFSASLVDSDKNISLLGDAKVFYTKQKHDNLISPGPALTLAKNILNNDTELPGGISMEAYPLNGTRVSTHSPVALHIYDSLGHHTGPTSDDNFEQTIPGSIYDTLGDASFIWLPDDGQYAIKVESIGTGAFDLKVKTYENDINTAATLFHNTPLALHTKTEMVLDTSSPQSSSLQVDTDGDGTTDNTVGPTSTLIGGANYDETPPQTAIEFTGSSGDNSWYRNDILVRLNATDEASGSAIQTTEYSLDNGQTIHSYTQPFIVSQESTTTILFRSIDQAGNEEIPQRVEIKIDKTPPEANIHMDEQTKNIIVEGIDTNPTIVTKSPGSYEIRDIAGNTLHINVRERNMTSWDKLSVISLRYNNNPPINFSGNHLSILYLGNKRRWHMLYQHFIMRRNTDIQIIYLNNINKSIVLTKERKLPCIKEVKEGLVTLQLLTNNGNLETRY